MKGENSIKLYGNDLQTLTDTANKIKSVLAPCRASPTSRCSPRSASRPSRSTSTAPARRATACRRATSTPPSRSRSAATAPAISTSPAATAISRSSSGSRREYRKSAEAIHNLRIGVAGPGGAITQIPLSEVATINLVSGAAYIYREQQERYLPIKFSVRDRDLGSAIQEAQDKVADAGPAAAGLAGRMGRRVRQSAGRHQAAVDRGADQPRADRRAAVLQFRLDGRHAARHERDPDGDLRRRARPR